jgi:leader peptidase (prepilin peptidase)/N-methyltransferase
MIISIITGVFFAALLVYAAVTDIKRREVDDWVCVSILIVSFIGSGGSFGGAVITALPFFIPALCKGGIGGGDVKLMFACGAVLGVWGGITQIIISLSLVALFSLFICIKKGFVACRKTAIPLAPFLCAGGIASFFITNMGGFIF